MRIYTGGTFDVLHVGHIHLFQEIKKLFPYSYLIVSLNTDEFIEEYKHKLPLFSYEERKQLLEICDLVDEVVPNEGGTDSKIAILKAKPDLIVIGTDWLQRDYCAQMGFTAAWLEDNNIGLLYLPYTKGISTTIIKERLNAK